MTDKEYIESLKDVLYDINSRFYPQDMETTNKISMQVQSLECAIGIMESLVKFANNKQGVDFIFYLCTHIDIRGKMIHKYIRALKYAAEDYCYMVTIVPERCSSCKFQCAEVGSPYSKQCIKRITDQWEYDAGIKAEP